MSQYIELSVNLSKVEEYVNKQKIVTNTKTVDLSGCIFSLTDYKISPKLAFKEDEMFERDPELQKSMTRGLFVVKHNNVTICVRNGMKKFGYSTYEDKTGSSPGMYFVASKENGESFHLSGFQYNSIKYIIAGSKNVHLVVRKDYIDEDLKLYDCITNQRYTYAVQMLKDTITRYVDISNPINYCINNRVTICFERCSRNFRHIVDYKENDNVYALCMTHTDMIGSDLYCHGDITETQKIFKDMGLDVASNISIEGSDKNSLQQDLKKYYNHSNSEGCVVYCINNNKVTYMFKYKNFKYIYLRAIRTTATRNDEVGNFKGRFDKLFKEVINVYPTYDNGEPQELFGCKTYEELNLLAVHFLSFIKCENKNLTGEKLDVNDFLKWWNEFLQQPQEIRDSWYNRLLSLKEKSSISDIQVVFVGIPGSGKTTLGKCISRVLPNGVYIDQDICNGNKKRFLNSIKQSMINGDNVVIGKNNHNCSLRRDMLSVLNHCNNRYAVVMYHSSDSKNDHSNLLSTCIERVNKRGNNHASLVPSDKVDINTVLSGFVNSYQPLTPSETKDYKNIIRVDVSLDTKTQLLYILSQIDECNYNEVNIDGLINEVYAEEKKTQPEKSVEYYGVKIESDDIQEVISENMENIILSLGIKLKTEFHVTVCHHSDVGFNNIKNIETLNKNIGETFNFHIKEFRYTDRIVLFSGVFEESDIIDSNNNRQFHITLGVGANTRPDFSNTVLEENLGEFIGMNTTVSGSLCKY